MLNSRCSELRVMFFFNDEILPCSCYSCAIHQVFNVQEALVIGVATGLAFKSSSIYICQGYQPYQLFAIVLRPTRRWGFFCSWYLHSKELSMEQVRSSSPIKSRRGVGKWNMAKTWMDHGDHVDRSAIIVSLLLLTCVKYFLLTPPFWKLKLYSANK